MKKDAIDKLGTREILACAMLNEKIACHDYKVLGELMELKHSPQTAKIFYEASKGEMGHFKRLQKTLYRIYGLRVDDQCELPFALECQGGFGDDTDSTFTGMSEEEAIKFLEGVEKNAEEFYLRAADVTDRIDLKPLFKSMAMEERNHRSRVKKIARKGQSRSLPQSEAVVSRPYN